MGRLLPVEDSRRAADRSCSEVGMTGGIDLPDASLRELHEDDAEEVAELFRVVYGTRGLSTPARWRPGCTTKNWSPTGCAF